MLAGKEWAPSLPSASDPIASRSGSPAPSQGLRKARASTRNVSSRSASPALTPQRTPDLSTDQKGRNEAYFASLGRDNANRPLDLPPSQGGRYTGFGSTPAPSEQPSFALSSAAAPTLSDFQENPTTALSKGWSLFSAAVMGASYISGYRQGVYDRSTKEGSRRWQCCK